MTDNLSYSKGICWIDDCRIPFVENVDLEQKQNQKTNGDKYGGGKGFHKEPIIMQMYKSEGRFPANILVSDDVLNDGVISKTSQKNKVIKNTTQMFNYSVQREYPEINDKGTNSRYYNLDKWFDKLLDE